MNLTIAQASEVAGEVLDEVDRAVVGKREELATVLAGILAGGHVLLEDLPGLGKTLAARCLAQALGLDFARTQFTPDLLPADLTGSFMYQQDTGEFSFRPGPIFAGLLLADEINRTPPKTQAALLEAMQEKQVTVEGKTFPLPRPFHVLATANPIEHEGTYPLPEAQLDRFLLRLSLGYLEADQEVDVLSRRIQRKQEGITVDPVCSADLLVACQQAVEEVYVSDQIKGYVVDIVRATRHHEAILVGASPRGALALVLVARARALIAGRDFVTPDDVKMLAEPALAHRLILRPELWLSDVTPAAIVYETMATIPIPDAR